MATHDHYFSDVPASAGEQRTLRLRLRGRDVLDRIADAGRLAVLTP